MGKYCAHGLCNNSDTKLPGKEFALFVQPRGRNADIPRAKRWLHLMGRKNFVLEDIKRHTYVCEDHFPENVDQQLTNQDYYDYRKVRR